MEGCNEIDRLYENLCNDLRKTGKASSFCQMIKNAKSDLKRIIILNRECNIVPNLIKTITKCELDCKDLHQAEKLLQLYYSKQNTGTESEHLIRLLNSAIVHLQVDEVDRKFKLKQFDSFDNKGIVALENLLVNSGEEVINNLNNQLLSKVYDERSKCFFDLDDHKMSIVESLRAIYYAQFDRNDVKEDLLPLLFRISSSLRHLNHLEGATNVLQFTIKLLRSSHLDNAIKSVETMKLVKLFKEIQSSIPGNGAIKVYSLDFDLYLQPRRQSFPAIFDSYSDALTNTSSCLQLNWDKDRGRFLVATKTIPPGKMYIFG